MRRTVPVQRSFALVGIQDRYLHHSQALFGSSVSARNPLASRRFFSVSFSSFFFLFSKGKGVGGGNGGHRHTKVFDRHHHRHDNQRHCHHSTSPNHIFPPFRLGYCWVEDDTA